MSRLALAVLFLVLSLVVPRAAHAQFTELDAAAPDAAPAGSSVVAPPPSQTATPSRTEDRPAQNPAMRERHPPPSRVGATMRGGVILAILVFFAGSFLWKRIKRRR